MVCAPNNNAITGDAKNETTSSAFHDEIDPNAAKHTRDATRGIGSLMWRFFVRLKWQYFPLLLSDYGNMILRRKYDAIATDYSYVIKPSGKLGPIGRKVDEMVLNFPLHEGLRQRLALVSGGIENGIVTRLNDGRKDVRVLSAPCGVIKDLLTVSDSLQERGINEIEKVELHALDLDPTGEVLPIARERAKANNLDVTFYRADLFDSKALASTIETKGRFDIVNCIGLTAWLTIEETEQLARYFREHVLAEDGTLIVDNFAWHEHSAIGGDLEIYTKYHEPADFENALRNAGFTEIEPKMTANGVNTVYQLSSNTGQ